MAKNLEISLLFDFYGDMLTEKQQNMIQYTIITRTSPLPKLLRMRGLPVRVSAIPSNAPKPSLSRWKNVWSLPAALTKSGRALKGYGMQRMTLKSITAGLDIQMRLTKRLR